MSSRSNPIRGLAKTAVAALVVAATLPGTAQAAVELPTHPIIADTPKIEDPDRVVRQYLQAVDRGEPAVFGPALDRTMIVPVRVEYVYALSSRTTRIQVYSNLKQPLTVPGQTGCQILGVNAVMEEGHITEIESHVWMK